MALSNGNCINDMNCLACPTCLFHRAYSGNILLRLSLSMYMHKEFKLIALFVFSELLTRSSACIMTSLSTTKIVILIPILILFQICDTTVSRNASML
jgi:hypothetical protein